MGNIRPLPEDVASRIAAGEVIERPASVLKELIENALDSGAAKIDIAVEEAGRKLIRVADDGSGMTPEDCRAAFDRHATSKIRDLADIEALATFGFRGEALFSIAAVSETVLLSAPQEAREGWRVEMKGGKLASQSAAPGRGGTILEVRKLFFNTPARAKFLKTDSSERSHLARVVEEAALANPGVGFSYRAEGRSALAFAPQKRLDPATLRRRVLEVLGSGCAEAMLFAESSSNGLSVRAFFSPADALTASRGLQFCFINRRPVSSRTVQQALYRAYEPFRPKNRHPAAVVFLDIPSDRLDVNVHPTKREVRFRAEGVVFEAVVKTLSRALLEAKGIPTLAESLSNPSSPRVSAGAATASPDTHSMEGLRLRAKEYRYSLLRDQAPHYAEPRGAELRHPAQEKQAGPRPMGGDRPWFGESIRYLGQIERAYLLFEVDGGLLVIDQHAAQERILFERYLAEAGAGRPSVQRLMLPLPVDLPASGIERVLAQRERLDRAGFDVEAYGKTTLHVLGVPAVFHKAKDIKEMVHSLLEGLLSPDAAAADIRYDATATIACKAAVKAHDPLNQHEALGLIADLRKCKDGACCPHGRPTMLSLDREELARKFKRPGAPPL